MLPLLTPLLSAAALWNAAGGGVAAFGVTGGNWVTEGGVRAAMFARNFQDEEFFALMRLHALVRRRDALANMPPAVARERAADSERLLAGAAAIRPRGGPLDLLDSLLPDFTPVAVAYRKLPRRAEFERTYPRFEPLARFLLRPTRSGATVTVGGTPAGGAIASHSVDDEGNTRIRYREDWSVFMSPQRALFSVLFDLTNRRGAFAWRRLRGMVHDRAVTRDA